MKNSERKCKRCKFHEKVIAELTREYTWLQERMLEATPSPEPKKHPYDGSCDCKDCGTPEPKEPMEKCTILNCECSDESKCSIGNPPDEVKMPDNTIREKIGKIIWQNKGEPEEVADKVISEIKSAVEGMKKEISPVKDIPTIRDEGYNKAIDDILNLFK